MTQRTTFSSVRSIQHGPPRRLDGKVALVTGGGTGIGRSAALAYAREGARVVLAGRRKAEIEAVVHEIAAAGGQALAVSADVAQEEEVRRLIGAVIGHYGQLNIAFNNAGVLGNVAPIAELSSTDFDKVMTINLRGIWLSIKYEIEAMVAQGSGGAIVNTSSWLAHGALAGTSVYSASKGALDALIRAVAIEYGPQGIRINNINPGIIDTPMARGSLNDDDSAFVPFIEHTPAKRVGQPDDAGDVAVWLSTDESRFVTGQNILVDGGYTIAGLR
ncbi:SDR family NAD(P)-dependent oxidoreductase [Pseudomonas aeruginosa]|uniref:SDR family NAD(P)-dependent oxidoreductase n=1 Tax=Pseudomonas aeruginosa TaxID=287 RepID=UPI00071B999F|nr:glucose 1-dehydrogenase [Pseudomonas aeruginosa]EKV3034558.1 glucose 1-dehydrogenase [Pseudomonas aeruginosa]EKV3077006.1 glucose 1-dehydrogenase [Pseudomonas aeruginosa]EKW2598518.1 glucose 1-dehydrogenase [Pseudomonas aeruginosa]EME5141365.1 glucose 1-dehydrogenase [Pseudomonas aeruginosa]KSM97174.1 oxidoreductase [Pseudomonas aeruginosa]